MLLKTSPGGLSTEPLRRLNAYLGIPPPPGFSGEAWGAKLLNLLEKAIAEATAEKRLDTKGTMRSVSLTALHKANTSAGLETNKPPEVDKNKGVKFIR